MSHLLTIVDVDARTGPRTMSLSALHVVVLDDGHHVKLLDDRGWTGGPADIWRHTSVEAIAATARAVVGPDEPFDGQSRQDAETAHWQQLAGVLERQGIHMGAEELSHLPHDVELSERVRLRLSDA